MCLTCLAWREEQARVLELKRARQARYMARRRAREKEARDTAASADAGTQEEDDDAAAMA